MNKEIPLIVPIAASYFKKAMDSQNDFYYRSIDIRLCLERIADSMIYEFVTSDIKEKWNGYKLHKKLLMAKEFLDNKVVSDLIDAKEFGNMAAHEGVEANITENNIEFSLEAVSNFSVEMFVSYFKVYGFHNNGPSKWAPTILSVLPPKYRIQILNKYLEYDKSYLVIRKLTMAYLKNGQNNECFQFIERSYNDHLISRNEAKLLSDDMELLMRSISLLPISKNLEMARDSFQDLITSIPDNEINKFALLVSMILGIELVASTDSIT
ncbi:hypothetical protein F4V43_19285 [Paenibacillus spiritus]|uniref:DUF4145 domain-containing protein n=1 Tax=Paenibacillus spiritus TaxID=2496557 RepID=A0A5J5FRU8_9BACL|nr:hypothetical protein [Paenibacillus spiritus]KAA8995544.1 hypothetical protein F4V43_19285 [Paenibacillus spiritus]